jgi:hypothetical protein
MAVIHPKSNPDAEVGCDSGIAVTDSQSGFYDLFTTCVSECKHFKNAGPAQPQSKTAQLA